MNKKIIGKIAAGIVGTSVAVYGIYKCMTGDVEKYNDSWLVKKSNKLLGKKNK